ncbi:ribonuclease H-like domain-containing protein [Tanacetum coccineum]
MTRNVNEVVAKLSDKNPYILPPNLQQLEGTTHIFQFHFDSMTRRPDFVLDRVFPTTILSLPPPELVEVPPESSTVPDIQKTPTLIQTPTSQITLSKDPADKKNTDSKVARTSTKKVPFHVEPDTSSSLLDPSKQEKLHSFYTSKSRQARDGKQESSSKRRQARVDKKETGGKQETAIDEKAENTVKECMNWKDKKKDKEQEALLISEDTAFVITGENIGPKPNPVKHELPYVMPYLHKSPPHSYIYKSSPPPSQYVYKSPPPPPYVYKSPPPPLYVYKSPPPLSHYVYKSPPPLLYVYKSHPPPSPSPPPPYAYNSPPPPSPPPPPPYVYKSLPPSGLPTPPGCLLLIYVDDIIFTASSPVLLQQIIDSLHNFDMTDLGALNYFLGISVVRHSTGLFLSQKKSALQLLERAHMVYCNPSRTPVDTKTRLGPDGVPVQDHTLYRNLAEGLQYLTFTCPDLSYAVQQTCLYMHNPMEPHFAALKCVMRYVKGILDLGLHLYASATTSLVGYNDADWAGCPSTHRSTSGYCVFLGDNLLSWSAKRQHTISRSSAEVEYQGVANVVAETAWVRNLLRELHSPLMTATLVYCDNVTGHVRVLHVPCRFRYADIFTKGLPSALFEDFRSSLSIRSSCSNCRGSILGLAVVVCGIYCISRYVFDIGMRRDVIKILVERLVRSATLNGSQALVETDMDPQTMYQFIVLRSLNQNYARSFSSLY